MKAFVKGLITRDNSGVSALEFIVGVSLMIGMITAPLWLTPFGQ